MIYATDRPTSGRAICDTYLSTLSGQKTSSGVILNDPEDGNPRLFFIFPDLSVRVLGEYYLLCHIYDTDK